MKKILLFAIVAGGIVLGYYVYRAHVNGSQLQVDPKAAEEIEKAKRR
jgi:hypothetical protein